VPANFILANRLDAVGSTSEANTLYKEGTGYPALTPFSIDYSFVRDACGHRVQLRILRHSLNDGVADTAITRWTSTSLIRMEHRQCWSTSRSSGAGKSCQSNSTQWFVHRRYSGHLCRWLFAPNQIRDLTSVPAQNSTFGTIELRRVIVNNTGANVTRLRFRVTQQTTSRRRPARLICVPNDGGHD